MSNKRLLYCIKPSLMWFMWAALTMNESFFLTCISRYGIDQNRSSGWGWLPFERNRFRHILLSNPTLPQPLSWFPPCCCNSEMRIVMWRFALRSLTLKLDPRMEITGWYFQNKQYSSCKTSFQICPNEFLRIYSIHKYRLHVSFN